jgi:hypothetical protein
MAVVSALVAIAVLSGAVFFTMLRVTTSLACAFVWAIPLYVSIFFAVKTPNGRII